MKIYNSRGFTMTELVVTMTIILILATISFISFNGYVSGSRDSKRIVDLESISTSLEIYYKKNGGVYPKPEDFVTLSYTGSDSKLKRFSYLGFVKDGMDLSFNGIPRDPITQDYYAFGVTVDKKFYELSCALENYPSDPIGFNFIDTTYAAGVDYAYIVGNYKPKTDMPKHLIILEQSGAIAAIPRDDMTIGTVSGTGFTVLPDVKVVDKLSDVIPYPIYNTKQYKSVSNQTASGTFYIVPPDSTCDTSTEGQSCIPITCGDNCE